MKVPLHHLHPFFMFSRFWWHGNMPEISGLEWKLKSLSFNWCQSISILQATFKPFEFHRCCVSFFLAYLWPAGPARPSREARFRLEGRWFMTRHPMRSDINTPIAMLKKSLSCHIMLLNLYHANANGFHWQPFFWGELKERDECSRISRSWRLGNAVECQLDQWQGTETPQRLVHKVMSCGFIGLRNVAMLQEVFTKYHQKKLSKQ